MSGKTVGAKHEISGLELQKPIAPDTAPLMRARQLNFLPTLKVSDRIDHGGSLRQGKRKEARPFSAKRPLHVVLRSTKARGAWSLLHPAHARRIEQEILRIARLRNVRVYRRVNVGNHVHLLIRAKSRINLRAFLRGLSGSLATLVTGARKGNSLASDGFWDALPYSRIVSWGREYATVSRYFVKNAFEAAGFGPI